MALSRPGMARQKIGVLAMAAALAASAFIGAALGLVWQSSGFGDDGGEEVATSQQVPQAD